MKFGSRFLSLDSPRIMGILNVTPDSFSDGGRFVSVKDRVSTNDRSSETIDVDSCLRSAEQMTANGAHFIDIGGESTRPGAAKVGSQQEMDRVLPVLEKISANIDVILSVDTSNPELIRESAKLGAGLINDVRALEKDGALEAAAKTGLPVCLMHMQGNPKTMQEQPRYESVVSEVQVYLNRRVAACVDAGIARNRIILDPGLGFGKSLEHNHALLDSTELFVKSGMPVLIGVSRKSMIGRILDRDDPSDRLAGSLALAYDQMIKGANILRVHDVRETADMLKIYEYMYKKHSG